MAKDTSKRKKKAERGTLEAEAKRKRCRWWNTAKQLILCRLTFWLGVFVVALSLALLSLWCSTGEPWKDLFLNLGTELLGGFLIYVLIDRTLARQEKKGQLIRQMGSSNNDTTKDAVRDLRSRGWLTDGSLRLQRLDWANLEGARLQEADLIEAILANANLEGAKLGKAQLAGANLVHINLKKADLTGADLKGANLFQNSDLTGATLVKTDFQGANLQGAYLLGANWEGACLAGANLRDATLTGAKRLTVDQLKQAKTLEGAMLPNPPDDEIRLPGRTWEGGKDEPDWRTPFEKWCETVKKNGEGYIWFEEG